ncbi:sugar O-acetyltransferase [Vibrio hippocampi]|uniref:Maltose O-acetyltransferase n=1 Tax=Vibrio hippocampi TaxID=654686 RepID=A0ABN8DNU7_9VIBR|nr:sugar O-acetyltransferase [Vibrio hippocampi]CAH0529197.1 Maltose O-acetyltransferase [Vibrio hippocampi]
MNEKQKMQLADNVTLFDANDKGLVKERRYAKHLCMQINNTQPDTPERSQLLKQLFGRIDLHIEAPFFVDYGYHLKVGKGFFANHGCTILDSAPVTIGDNCLLAPNVTLSTANHPLDRVQRAQGLETCGPITIGNDVWLGAGVTVLSDVTIGDNVVVAAGAVVTKDVAANCVVAGVPAKVIRQL